MPRAILLAMFALRAASAADGDPLEVLSSVIAKVRANDQAMPNYTCVETVDRDFYRPASGAPVLACALRVAAAPQPLGETEPVDPMWLTLSDRLRLDVALVQRGEIYSWLGASRFDEGGIDRLVRRGPIATGGFGAMFNMVFRENAAGFHFERAIILDGRSLMQYSFDVKQPDSHYKVKMLAGEWYIAPYHGTFLADRATAEVVRLTFQTAPLPETVGTCQTTIDMDFDTQRIGGAPLLLPRQVRQRFLNHDGRETRNTITFSRCREYQTQSTITFDTDPGTRAPGDSGAPPRPATIRPGLRFSIELASPLRADQAAAGDPFTGRLLEPLKDGRRVIAQKGAVVEGRLLRLEIYRQPAQVMVALQPRSIEIGGTKVPFAARYDWSAAKKSNKNARFILPERSEQNAGVFAFPGTQIVLDRKFRSDWITVQSP